MTLKLSRTIESAISKLILRINQIKTIEHLPGENLIDICDIQCCLSDHQYRCWEVPRLAVRVLVR